MLLDLMIGPDGTPAAALDAALAILLLAMIIDLFAGDPKWLYRLIPHPVVLIGRGVDFLERRLNRQRVLPRNYRVALTRSVDSGRAATSLL